MCDHACAFVRVRASRGHCRVSMAAQPPYVLPLEGVERVLQRKNCSDVTSQRVIGKKQT